MFEVIKAATEKGAWVFPNVSGGKDGQAMTIALHRNGVPLKGLVHADLGEMEWHQSLGMCESLAAEVGAPLHIVTRRDGMGLLQQIEKRMHKLAGTGKPFWPSPKNRYCTSDNKRDQINVFYNNCGHDFIVSCLGIRADESTNRAKMEPVEINWRLTSKFYEGMTVQQAIDAYKPGKKLVIQVYPIFNFSDAEVWATCGNSQDELNLARAEYKATGLVPTWWNFHPAYVFGNQRVSCVFCVMGKDCGDLTVGAQHRPELLAKLAAMEQATGMTFKPKFALSSLVA